MKNKFQLGRNILDLTTAKNNLEEIVNEVLEEHNEKLLIVDNQPAVVLVNVEDYQNLQWQLEILELRLASYQAKEEYKRGETLTLQELRESLFQS